MALENKISLEQKLSQKLIISPQQIQGVKMLELPTLELEERIEQELNNNPALEEIDDEPLQSRDESNNDSDDDDFDENDQYDDTNERTDSERFEELNSEDLNGHFSDDDTYDAGFYDATPTQYGSNYNDFTSYKSRINDSENDDREIPFAAGTTFKEYLLDQVGTLPLSEHERELVEYVLNNLNDDGYLTRDAHRMENDLLFSGVSDVDEQQIAQAIQIIQSLDPAGVGAIDLEECLLLQLKRKPQTDTITIATRIVSNDFEHLKNKHYNRILQRIGCSEEMLKSAIEEISKLNPKPGQQWNGDIYERNANILVPDFYVTHRNGYWEITLNNDHIPRLRVNEQYNKWATDYRERRDQLTPSERNSGKFAQPYVNDALAFIKNLNDRNTNLLRIMETIVKAQEQFFLLGDDQVLQPLVLEDIANKVELDTSTVSRICKMKFVSCDVGTFPLKHFFSESITDIEGNEISTRSVKSVLKEIIDHEDKTAPANDDAIADIMAQRGMPIARRTVAKYREEMGIPIARLRKKI